MLQMDPLRDLFDHLAGFLDMRSYAIIKVLPPHRMPSFRSAGRRARCGGNWAARERFCSPISNLVRRSEFRDM